MNIDASLLDVLNALKKNIMKNLKVATLGIVKEVDETKKILKVDTFPKSNEEKEATQHTLIQCKYFNDGANVNDIVLVLFLDRNFLANLSRMENGITEILSVSSEELHSEKYGIAIKTL